MKVDEQQAIEDALSGDDGDDVMNDITMLNDDLRLATFALLLSFDTPADDPDHTVFEIELHVKKVN